MQLGLKTTDVEQGLEQRKKKFKSYSMFPTLER